MIGDSFYSSQKSALITLSLILLLSAAAANAQTTSFTYQGRLTDGSTAANGNYDLQLALFDNSSGGTQVGTTQTVSTVSVSGGVFTVQLDFGAAAFPGANRFLEISVRLSGGGSFTTLSPRQPISSTPYAIRSLNASSADAVTVSGVPGGSGNYIQNTASQQESSNFNISGDGTVGGNLFTNGKVAIGTAVSTARLSVGQSTTGPGVIATADGSTMIIGTGTQFTSTFAAGDMIIGPGLPAGTIVASIASDTLLTLDRAARATASNVTYKLIGGTRLVVQDKGNVGIGTSSPSFKLDVSNSSSNDIQVQTTGGTSSWARINMKTSNQRWIMGTSQNFNGDQFYLLDDTNSQTRMTIQPNGGTISFPTGNVGIGTTTPTDPLTIKTLTNTFGMVQTDGTITVGSYVGGSGVGGWYGTRSPHPLHFFVNNGSPSMTVAYPSGYVGVGTTAPVARLTVNGTAWFQGDNTPLSGKGVAVGFTTNNQGYVFALDYGTNTARDLILNGPGGNVGIGTASPDEALSVNGGADKSGGGGSWAFFSDERLKNIKGHFTPGLKAVMQLQPIRFEYKRDNAMGISRKESRSVSPRNLYKSSFPKQ